MAEITVFGGGTWGTALAVSAAKSGHSVMLWCRRAEQARAINATSHNPDYLQSIALPEAISSTSDPEEAALFSQHWILALPTQTVRGFLPALAPFCGKETEVCNVAKGIEIGTGARISAIVSETLPEVRYSVLSGRVSPGRWRKVSTARLPPPGMDVRAPLAISLNTQSCASTRPTSSTPKLGER